MITTRDDFKMKKLFTTFHEWPWGTLTLEDKTIRAYYADPEATDFEKTFETRGEALKHFNRARGSDEDYIYNTFIKGDTTADIGRVRVS